MIKKLVIVICCFFLCGCYNVPDVKYGDRVRITRGFYKGHEGKAIGIWGNGDVTYIKVETVLDGEPTVLSIYNLRIDVH